MIEVSGLTKLYGELVAVEDLSFEVASGEVLGLVGPNGAGKTTTLRAAAGLLRPVAGEIRIAGASLAREPMAARARFGFVPDKPSLYAGLPDDPKISPMVGIWKGILKPISLAAIAFAGVFGFLHYITKGPNEVSESDERKADELAGGQSTPRGRT